MVIGYIDPGRYMTVVIDCGDRYIDCGDRYIDPW